MMVGTCTAMQEHLTVSVWLFRSRKLTPEFFLFAVGQVLFLDWSQLQENLPRTYPCA